MVPSFIPVDLANKILVIGKSINFMRKCCNDTEWVLGVLGTSITALFKRFMSAKKLKKKKCVEKRRETDGESPPNPSFRHLESPPNPSFRPYALTHVHMLSSNFHFHFHFPLMSGVVV